jgi:hypothetical protein
MGKRATCTPSVRPRRRIRAQGMERVTHRALGPYGEPQQKQG